MEQVEYKFTMFDGARAKNLSEEEVLDRLPSQYEFDGDRATQVRFSVVFDPVLIRYEVTANVPIKNSISPVFSASRR